ncbi:MAG: hypothetical protein AAB719_01940 [Patescibacteria group bacterium]
MSLFSRIRDLAVSFLFPKNKKILALEALSAKELRNTLPKAEQVKNKNTFALFDYAHPLVKEMIWELKYGGNRQIALKFGEILFEHIEHELLEKAVFEKGSRPLLVPVPVSDKRRFERGWNQSELLAEEIIKFDRKKFLKYLPRQLVKTHHTESQTQTSSRTERLKNITHSMKVLNPSSVAGECLILIDDVTTTGSTFAEAERTLRSAGAKEIFCLALAH